MKLMDKSPLINEYVTHVCRQIRAYEKHPDIRNELESHILELAHDIQSDSPKLGQDEALEAAITQMGDPIEVGNRFDRIHQPRTDWSLVTIIVILLGMALIIMYSAEKSLHLRSGVYPFELFDKKAAFIAISLLLLVVVRLIDYRKIIHYSSIIYWCMVVLMIATIQFGISVNGVNQYLSVFGIRIPVMSLSPYVLIMALCGLLFAEGNPRHPWKQWVTYVCPPLIIYMMSSNLTLFLFYFLIAFILFSTAYRSWLFRILVPISHLFLISLLVFTKPFTYTYLKERLTSYLNPYGDPQGMGYMTVQSMTNIREAGWLGNGIGTPNLTLPHLFSDGIFVYIIFSLGWLGGLVLIWTILALIVRIVVAARKVKDNYGKHIIIGLGSLLGLKFIWSIGMTLGLLPWTSVQLPFIAFGGTSMVADMMAVGLIMGIYRRKDMNRFSSQPSSFRINY